MRKSVDELDILLKSRIECIWVQTFEEEDFINDVRDLLYNNEDTASKYTHWNLAVWSTTEGGFYYPRNEFEEKVVIKNGNAGTKDIAALMNQISINSKDISSANTIWILRDLEGGGPAQKVARLIRDLKEYPSNKYNPIIVVSTTMEIPETAQKLFRVINYDLMDYNDIKTQITEANESLRQQAKDNNIEDVVVINDDEIDRIAKACSGLTHGEITRALNESCVRYHTLNLDFISRSKIELVKKSGVLDYRVPKVSLDDIGGNAAIKEWLEATKHMFSDEAREFDCDLPKGYVAVGVPGAGKTCLAEAFAKSMNLPLIEFSVSKIFDKLVGSSERKATQALNVVKACAPCVLLLDEVEKLFGGVQSSNQSDGGVTNRVFQEILKFMQDNDSGIYVIMTSNDVSQLPPELTRAERLDAMWYFGLPSAEERKSIFKIHFGKKNKTISDVILHKAVEATKGYTGAEIKQVVKEAVKNAYFHYIKDGNDMITIDDITKAARNVIPVSRSSKEKIAMLEHYCKDRALNASTGASEHAPKKAASNNNYVL